MNLKAYLKGNAVLRSSDLIARLCADGCSEANARQIIRRHAQPSAAIWRSTNLKLARNERLFATAEFRKRPEFLGAVAEKLAGANRLAMARCLSVLSQRRVLHKVDAMRLLAVGPADATGRAVRRYENELEGINELGVEVVFRGTALESLVAPNGGTNESAAAEAAAQGLRLESVIARVLVERLRRENLLAWNPVEMSEPSSPYIVFNQQVFTASGCSYLSPLVRWRADKPIPCPVMIDCYHEKCERARVDSFVQRIERVAHRGHSKMPVLGVIAALGFDRDAWKEAKSHGFLAVDLRQAFGNEALEAMALVEHLVTSICDAGPATEVTGAVEQLSARLEELKANPVVTDLRAIGFEILAALVLRSLGYEQIGVGRVIPWKATKRDVDVYGIRGDGLYVVECKAHHGRKSVSPDDVGKFFTETVPAIKDWFRSNGHAFTTCKAEVWTTGPKGKEAGDKLYQLPRPKTDEWNILRREEIKDLLPASIRDRVAQMLDTIALGAEPAKNEDA